MEVDGTEDRHTLYVNNLYEKISPDKLSKAMRCIFNQFGNILDVVARRTNKLRGQAWVVFENEADAADALKHMQGFPFFNKPIRIAYAKEKSDAVARMDGTYDEQAVEERRRKRRIVHEASKPMQAPPSEEPRVPETSKTLYVENIPNEANEGMLVLVFQRFAGLKEVRMARDKPGVAFVEYDNEVGAAAALAGLQGFKLATNKPMQLSYAKI